MKLKSKPLALAMLSGALLLSACSSNSGDQAGQASGSNGSDGKQVTLNTVFLGSSWGQATQELAKEYEKETGVKVNVELVGRDVIYQKLALSIAGQANYDLFNVDYNWIPEFASTGSLLPLDDYLKKNNVDTSKYLPRALALSQWNDKNGSFGEGGTIYGLPQSIHPQLLWYRSDLFNDPQIKEEFKAKYGYDLVPPKDMKQFRDAAESLTVKNITGKNCTDGPPRQVKDSGMCIPG